VKSPYAARRGGISTIWKKMELSTNSRVINSILWICKKYPNNFVLSLETSILSRKQVKRSPGKTIDKIFRKIKFLQGFVV
jgi:hypothetical protein